MRGDDTEQGSMFSYRSLEDRIPRDPPLRPMRAMVEAMADRFEALYAVTGRPSISPERLLRALLLQILFSVRSERQRMEQLAYNLLYRWFVGLGMDDCVWVPTTFTKNRDRLVEGDVAQGFFEAVLEQGRKQQLLSSEHFSVDGTKESRRCRSGGAGPWPSPIPGLTSPVLQQPASALESQRPFRLS